MKIEKIKTHFKPLSNQTLHPYAQRGLKMRYFILLFSNNKKSENYKMKCIRK